VRDWRLVVRFGLRGRRFGLRGRRLVERRLWSGDWRPAGPLLRLDEALQIREVVPHTAALALAVLDERYSEMPGATIAAQRVN